MLRLLVLVRLAVPCCAHKDQEIYFDGTQNQTVVTSKAHHTMRLPEDLAPAAADLDCEDPFLSPAAYYAACNWSSHTGQFLSAQARDSDYTRGAGLTLSWVRAVLNL